MKRDEALRLMGQVRANLAALDACRRHRLGPLEKRPLSVLRRTRCDVCGGELDYGEAKRYLQGYVAAGGRAEDVWPWYVAQGAGAGG